MTFIYKMGGETHMQWLHIDRAGNPHFVTKSVRGCLCNGCTEARAYEEREGGGSSRRRSGNFSQTLKNGTEIYGPNGIDKKPGHKHGHRGSNFDRSPHSTLGSGAVDSAMGKDDPGHTEDGHETDRW